MSTLPEALEIAKKHHHAGRFAEAQVIYERILAKKSDLPQVQYEYGILKIQLGQLDDAVRMIRYAMAHTPAPRAAMHLNLGEAYRRQNHLSQALAQFDRALALDPDMLQAYTNRALVFIEQEQYPQAIADLRQALTSHPQNADLLASLGYALRCNGEIDQALRVFEQALEINPVHPDAAFYYGAAHRFTEKDPIISRLEAALDNPQHQPTHRASLHFTLGKIYDDLKNFDHAFEHYRQGNYFKRQLLPYDWRYTEHLTDRFIRFFDKKFFERSRDWAMDCTTPIFIIGMPRSGTSLVEQILASHSRVGGGGELKTMGDQINLLPGRLQSKIGLPECLNDLSVTQARQLGQTYLDSLCAKAPHAQHVTDKHTINFQLLGLLAAFFPRARFIHIQRDPRDTCLSCYFQMFQAGQAFSYHQTDVAHYYHCYVRLMNHWKQTLPVPIFDLRYEDLVTDQETQTRRLMKACSLDWEPGCLAFHQNKRVIQTASVWQVRKPIYRRSVQRWRHYQAHLKPMLDLFSQYHLLDNPAPVTAITPASASATSATPSSPSPPHSANAYT